MDNCTKPSIFDTFLEEINNEDSPYNEKSIGETDGENSTINQVTNSNEHNNCDIMLQVQVQKQLQAFDDAFETIYGNNEVSFIQVHQICKELQTNCVHMINMIKARQSDSVEIEQLKSKYNLLKNESHTTINKLQLEVIKLNLRLKNQSVFSSIVGSTFSYYLWKATRISSVVDMVLEEDNIANIAKFMTSILSSFIGTYNTKMPSIKTNETKFVLHILGIVANLTTTKGGCHFFTQVKDGINIVNIIVSLVLCAPPSLDLLKKVAYAALYNVSIQCNGHLLMENNKLIQTLYNDIRIEPTKGNTNTILFSLNLLFSLTRNINKSMYIILKNEINLQEILKLTRYTETKCTAKKIFENINIANEKYNDMSD